MYLLDGRLGKTEGDIEKEETSAQMILSPKISAEEIPKRDENVVVSSNPLPITSIQVDTSIFYPPPTQMQRFRTFRRGACEDYGSLFGLGYIFIVFPWKQFIGALEDMAYCNALGDKSRRVPTFYSSYNNDNEDLPFYLAICVAAVFRAIHCIPWSFHFATLQERWVWRISAILILGMPISLTAVGFIDPLGRQGNNSTWMKVNEFFWRLIAIVLTFLYIIARMVLLVLPFVALRALPPGAYVQPDWVSFLPARDVIIILM